MVRGKRLDGAFYVKFGITDLAPVSRKMNNLLSSFNVFLPNRYHF